MKHNSRAIGSILEKVLQDINADELVAQKRILTEWETLFDSSIGKICRPVQFTQENELILEAISESWKEELLQVRPLIINVLKSKFNHLKIKNIKII